MCITVVRIILYGDLAFHYVFTFSQNDLLSGSPEYSNVLCH